MRVAVDHWPSATRAVIDGSEYLAFAGCDYLGLSHDKELIGAFSAGLMRFGVGANGSRETSGNTLSHERLEQTLANFIGTEASVLCPDGALANLAACQWFAQRYARALVAERAHASLGAAARAAGMRIETVDASDLNALGARLGSARGEAVLMTDSVFAADGARAAVGELVRLAREHECGVLLDDCHGLGVLGEGGRGCYREITAPDDCVVVTATLAKALGCAGGVCASTAATIEDLRRVAWAYRGTTPIPPALAAAAHGVIERLSVDPSLLVRLRDNIRQLRAWFTRLGLPLPPDDCPIFAFCPAPVESITRLQAGLNEALIWVPFIDYPGAAVPQYFRLAVNAAHTWDEIDRVGQLLASVLGGSGGG